MPGSYQFAVDIRNEYRPICFDSELPSPREVADRFLQILSVGVEDPEVGLAEIVPYSDYRRTFLKLTRDLAPDGKRLRQAGYLFPGRIPGSQSLPGRAPKS